MGSKIVLIIDCEKPWCRKIKSELVAFANVVCITSDNQADEYDTRVDGTPDIIIAGKSNLYDQKVYDLNVGSAIDLIDPSERVEIITIEGRNGDLDGEDEVMPDQVAKNDEDLIVIVKKLLQQ